jgi:hypothetical protein
MKVASVRTAILNFLFQLSVEMKYCTMYFLLYRASEQPSCRVASRSETYPIIFGPAKRMAFS